MQDFDTIIFDMYGVILKESKGNFIPYTFSHFDVTEHERLKRQFREEQLFTKAGNGEISSENFLSRLGFKDTDFHMKDYIENHLSLDSGFIPFAEKYYTGYEFVLLSNDVSEWSKYITNYYKLDKYFKNKIVSGDVQCRKPDEEIFRITLSRIKKQAVRCIFIDNSVANLRVAESIGLTPILFNRDNENYDGIIINSFPELDSLIEQGKYKKCK